MARVSEGSSPWPSHNEVRLVGRTSVPARRRELPSGDVVVETRVVVKREPDPQRPRGARFDAIDCVAWSESTQDLVTTWNVGDIVELSGALHRRFNRTETGVASRYQVEIREARLFRARARGELGQTGCG
ncbi:MAG TPA: single-stranded DNA-binding protein [Actinopolymorphaceae bacterium]